MSGVYQAYTRYSRHLHNKQLPCQIALLLAALTLNNVIVGPSNHSAEYPVPLGVAAEIFRPQNPFKWEKFRSGCVQIPIAQVEMLTLVTATVLLTWGIAEAYSRLALAAYHTRRKAA
jgi:hypothetical protein